MTGTPYRIDPGSLPKCGPYIVPTAKARYVLEADERRWFAALPWWRKLLKLRAHRRDPMGIDRWRSEARKAQP